MNKVQNDYGIWVDSIGAENSLERVKCTYPKTIASLKVKFSETPVESIISQDLVDGGYERCEADLIARAVSSRDEFGPSYKGSPRCESGSIASGGNRSHCSCDICF